MNALLRRLNGEKLSTGLQSDIQWTRTSEEDGWQNTGIRIVEK